MRQTLTLIVTTLALAGSGEWYGQQERALLHDVARPRQASHAHGGPVGYTPPSLVLQRVQDALTGVRRGPADAARTAHERRKIVAPPTTPTGRRVPASLTAGRRQQAQSSPAASADDARLSIVDRAAATRTGDWENEIGQRRDGAGDACRDVPGDAYCTERHMTSRSGGKPNQRSNAAAPCSMSITSPSIARRPRASTACTHGVSPRR